MRRTIGITLGDPCGVGPEIFLKSLPFLSSLPAKFILYGSKGVLDFYSRCLGLPSYLPSNVTFKDVFPLNQVVPGKPNLKVSIAQIEYIKSAVFDAKRRIIEGIVTLPINKETAAKGGFTFPGHTEFLAYLFGIKEFAMMLANEKLKVVLLTTHVPLREVPYLISKEKIIAKLKLIHASLNSPKIAVASLNPHGGEGGLFGREEIEVIAPAVKEGKELGIKVEGPISPDTVFVRALKGEFDVILCMYHDQGLIPIKLLGFGNSVNVTLGLPIVRTSVDHGTAYDIAGRGIAETESFKLAVRTALELLEGSGRGDPT